MRRTESPAKKQAFCFFAGLFAAVLGSGFGQGVRAACAACVGWRGGAQGRGTWVVTRFFGAENRAALVPTAALRALPGAKSEPAKRIKADFSQNGDAAEKSGADRKMPKNILKKVQNRACISSDSMLYYRCSHLRGAVRRISSAG
jgi:hypothetical protein